VGAAFGDGGFDGGVAFTVKPVEQPGIGGRVFGAGGSQVRVLIGHASQFLGGCRRVADGTLGRCRIREKDHNFPNGFLDSLRES
jgi:hypothetical protein